MYMPVKNHTNVTMQNRILTVHRCPEIQLLNFYIQICFSILHNADAEFHSLNLFFYNYYLLQSLANELVPLGELFILI